MFSVGDFVLCKQNEVKRTGHVKLPAVHSTGGRMHKWVSQNNALQDKSNYFSLVLPVLVGKSESGTYW